MNRFFFAVTLLFAGISAFAQPNMACFKDTSMVEEQIYKKDTGWVVKPMYQKGDWNLYYDYSLTKIKSEYHYDDNGNKIGTWKEYYKGGTVKSEWTYTGALVPLFAPGKEYYQNGAVKTERTQSADTVFETQYYQSGKIKSYNKWDKNGMWVLHHELCDNGTLLIKYNPTASVPQAVKKYHCNGTLRAEYNWYVFGYTGVYKEYHSNGKAAIEGQYTEKPADQSVFMARKTGTWTFYDDKGKVTKKEKWENGKLVSTEK